MCATFTNRYQSGTRQLQTDLVKTTVRKETAEPRSRGKGAIRVYNRLREDILSLKLPPGELLDDVKIGKQFNLSRSPVREALIRLSAEGLVKTLPNKNSIVAPLNIIDFSQFIDSLDLMQRVTSRLAAKLRTDADVQIIKKQQARFEKAVEKCDVLAMIEANKDFHLAISAAGKNSYFTQFCERLLDEGRRMLRLYFQSLGDTLPPGLAADHLELIKAIEDKDEDKAEKLARQHTAQVSERFLASLAVRHTTDMALTSPNET